MNIKVKHVEKVLEKETKVHYESKSSDDGWNGLENHDWRKRLCFVSFRGAGLRCCGGVGVRR